MVEPTEASNGNERSYKHRCAADYTFACKLIPKYCVSTNRSIGVCFVYSCNTNTPTTGHSWWGTRTKR